MFIKKTTRVQNGKTYFNHLLVESVATPKGPRHRVVCSLGPLAPAPPERWAELGHKLVAALGGQPSLFPDPVVEDLVEKVRAHGPRVGVAAPGAGGELVEVDTDRIEVTAARAAGSVHVAHQMWQRLGLDGILSDAGLSKRARVLTEVLTINRLVKPCSEHATPGWVERTALADVLGADVEGLTDDHLYRNLDRLHPKRDRIEQALTARERTLFTLAETLYLYDLTSTYFEGQCEANPSAKRGYSRDHRPDCKQVVIGFALDEDGFPKAHEIFEGNTRDRTTVGTMLDVMEHRMGKRGGATVVVDRGMAYDDTLELIRSRDYHYIVAGQPSERVPYVEDCADQSGWTEVVRESSPRNPSQKKSVVRIPRRMAGSEVHVLCASEGRGAKDRAIREKQEKRFLADLGKLEKRVAAGRLRDQAKVNQAIGRLKERYPRVARYYDSAHDAAAGRLSVREDAEKKLRAAKLDGGYVIRTSRTDMTDDEIWRTYMLLTRVENAFRDMKGPLMERPIFHQLQHRVETHIFLCVLAYHLLVAIEKSFLDAGIHTSWEALREQLATHQIVTVHLPTKAGQTLTIRKGTTPEPRHKEIYQTLGITDSLMTPVKQWVSR